MKKVGAHCSTEVFAALRDVAGEFDIDIHHVGLATDPLDQRQLEGCVGLIVELGHDSAFQQTHNDQVPPHVSVAGLPVKDAVFGTLDTSGVAHVLWGPSDVALWVETLPENSAHPTSQKTGGVITVWGPAGAPGRTTVAINTAATIAAAHHPVVLIDADLTAPSIAPLLGLTATSSGLVTACRVASMPAADSAAIVARAEMYRAPQFSFPVLTGVMGNAHYAGVDVLAWERVLDVLVEGGYWVVVDVAPGLSEEPGDAVGGLSVNGVARTAVRRSQQLIGVLRADPVSVVRWVREHTQVVELAPDVPLHVVINGVSPHHTKALENTKEALWEFAGVTETSVLPLDQETMVRLVEHHSTLAGSAPTTALAKALAQVAHSVVGGQLGVLVREVLDDPSPHSAKRPRKLAWPSFLVSGRPKSGRGITLKE
jgi:MinD-like ATPase involved in chromosome partitioning or flagellar assembly